VLTHAALQAGVGRRTVYDWLAGDAEFKAGYDNALREAIDNLEREAFRRRVEG